MIIFALNNQSRFEYTACGQEEERWHQSDCMKNGKMQKSPAKMKETKNIINNSSLCGCGSKGPI